MNGFMLDSNVLIDIAREPDGPVAARFAAKALGEVAISVIVSGEILYGMVRRPDARSNPRMSHLLSSLQTEKMEPAVASHFGRVRRQVEMSGQGLTANDYWIAAHAIAKGAVLVTGDKAIHEAGISELQLEDWRGELAVHGQD